MSRRRLWLLLGLAAVATVVAPETRANPEMLTGYASAYAPQVMEDVVRFRLENRLWRHIPPSRWIYADGYIATNNCRQVGLMVTLIDPAGEAHEVLVADCAGRDSTRWMTENRIIAELDWQMWERLTAAHGRPLEVGLR
jgi:hypothetical protein